MSRPLSGFVLNEFFTGKMGDFNLLKIKIFLAKAGCISKVEFCFWHKTSSFFWFLRFAGLFGEELRELECRENALKSSEPPNNCLGSCHAYWRHLGRGTKQKQTGTLLSTSWLSTLSTAHFILDTRSSWPQLGNFGMSAIRSQFETSTVCNATRKEITALILLPFRLRKDVNFLGEHCS